MRTFQEIKENYRFADPDIEILKGLLPVVEPHVEPIVSDFYNLLLDIPDTAKFLKDRGQAGLAEGAASEVGGLPCFRGLMTSATSSACSASATPMCASIFRPTSSTWA